MPKAINKTLSLTSEHIIILDELCDLANSDSSKIFRAFINYFKANQNEFQKIINGDYNIK